MAHVVAQRYYSLLHHSFLYTTSCLHIPSNSIGTTSRRIRIKPPFSLASNGSMDSLKIKNENISTRTPFTLPDDAPLVLDSISSTHFLTKAEVKLQGLSNRLVLIDGNAVMYRSYYKIMAKLHYGKVSNLSDDGDWVLTVFTALSMMLSILELSPSHIAVVFDHEGKTFRHFIYAEYKKGRPPTPDTVVQALQYIKTALFAMAIKTVEVPGVEADDVIGTLSMNALNAGMKVRVVSSDKDFFQLLCPSLQLLRFMPRGSIMVPFGMKEFQEKFGGLHPSQFTDFLALKGDMADNIPGVHGIGEKRAIDLLTTFGSLENLMQQREKVTLKKAQESLLADKGDVFMFKKLVTLRTDLLGYAAPFNLSDLVVKRPEDGGEKFMNLLNAMGSYVDEPFTAYLRNRTKQMWSRA